MSMNAAASPSSVIDYTAVETEALASMGEMPCCPDKGPAKSNCAQDCPLMAMCMAKTLQKGSACFTLQIQHTVSVATPGEELRLDGLSSGPPPRPPIA